MSSLPSPQHRRRLYAAVLLYMLGFSALLIIVLHYYLSPAMKAARGATADEKRILAVHSRLLLAVLLFVLLAMLLMTFRIGRFFMVRGRVQPRATRYIDAWSESARRLGTPPPGAD